MSSRRRSRSRDRAKNAGPSKLRMDSKPQTPRITGKHPSVPSGRRREIDNVMKKARASPNSNSYWDKKLLEVEAKDPNRWRHSGYKSMYLDGSSTPSSGRRSRSRSPPPRRSPPISSRRSPAMRERGRSPRSPPSRRTPLGRRSPRSPPMSSSRRSPAGGGGRLGGGRPRSPYARHPPAHSRRSPSASSVSSCSDDSCSVCSPKNTRGARSRSISPGRARMTKTTAHMKAHKKLKPRPPSPSLSPPTRRPPRPMTPPPTRRPVRPNASTSSSDKPTDPRRQPPPPRPRNRAGDIIDVTGVKPPPPKGAKKAKEKEPVLLTRIKKERTKKRPGSPSGAGDSSGSEDSSASSTSAIVATTRLTLSERFGKMAQWSVDRERRDNIENMRITKTGGDLKVMIEEDDFLYGSPPHRYSISPVPAGHFPDELLGNGPSRMAGWDDVRVRYQYYKDLGYLRDLTMDDYVKWEEWWYKYQDWLANERNYEHWMATQGRSSSSRRRRKLPATQRLN